MLALPKERVNQRCVKIGGPPKAFPKRCEEKFGLERRVKKFPEP